MIHILRQRWKLAVAWIVCFVVPMLWLCVVLHCTLVETVAMLIHMIILSMLMVVAQQGVDARRALEASQGVLFRELTSRATALELEIDNRALLATKIDEGAKTLGTKVDETVGGLHTAVKENGSHLAELITENTRKTEQAAEAAHKSYDVANHANIKITDLKKEIIDLSKKLLQETKDRKAEDTPKAGGEE